MYRLFILAFSIILSFIISQPLIQQIGLLKQNLLGKTPLINNTIVIFPLSVSILIFSIIIYSIIISLLEQRLTLFSLVGKLLIGLILVSTFTFIVFSF